MILSATRKWGRTVFKCIWYALRFVTLRATDAVLIQHHSRTTFLLSMTCVSLSPPAACFFMFYKSFSIQFIIIINHQFANGLFRWLLFTQKSMSSLIKYKRFSSVIRAKSDVEKWDAKHCRKHFFCTRMIERTGRPPAHTHTRTHDNRCFKINTDFSILIFLFDVFRVARIFHSLFFIPLAVWMRALHLQYLMAASVCVCAIDQLTQ